MNNKKENKNNMIEAELFGIWIENKKYSNEISKKYGISNVYETCEELLNDQNIELVETVFFSFN